MSITETKTEARPAKGRAIPLAKAIGRFLIAAVTTYLGLLAVTFFIGRGNQKASECLGERKCAALCGPRLHLCFNDAQ